MKKPRDADSGRWYNNMNGGHLGRCVAINPKINLSGGGWALAHHGGRWHLFRWRTREYSWPTLREAMRVSYMMYKMGVMEEFTSSN